MARRRGPRLTCQTHPEVTIGRTYEWYEMMGEFAGIYEKLEADGVCKYCGERCYCAWPPASTAPALDRASHRPKSSEVAMTTQAQEVELKDSRKKPQFRKRVDAHL